MKNKILGCWIFIFCLTHSTSFADKIDLQQGIILNISSTEFAEIEEDQLVANLRFETEGKNSTVVQSKVNSVMTEALASIKKNRNLNVYTGQYSVYKYSPNNKEKEITKDVWHANQSVIISGTVVDDIKKITSNLQEKGFAVNSYNYSLSTDKREKTRDSLMEQAIAKLVQKAQRVANSLGKKEIQIVNLNINTDADAPSPSNQFAFRLQSGVQNKIIAPVALPGQSQVSMAVTGKILIKN
ncbi:MAG: SIMPL domain-containing protein [Rickettsiaceae bacterium]